MFNSRNKKVREGDCRGAGGLCHRPGKRKTKCFHFFQSIVLHHFFAQTSHFHQQLYPTWCQNPFRTWLWTHFLLQKDFNKNKTKAFSNTSLLQTQGYHILLVLGILAYRGSWFVDYELWELLDFWTLKFPNLEALKLWTFEML